MPASSGTAHAAQWSEGALTVAQQLAGLDFLTGDGMLDEARRVLLMHIFSGLGLEDCAEQLKVPRKALDIARLMGDQSLSQVAATIEEARMFIWMGNFARLPGSAFMQQFAQFFDFDENGARRPMN